MVGRLVELMLFGLTPLLLCIIALPMNLAAEERKLFGQVFYKEKLALPPDAKLTVQLADISQQEATARIVGETTVTPAGRMPVPFQIPFDPKAIRSADNYALQARITVGGSLLFTTAQNHSVAPLSAGPQALVLQHVAGQKVAAVELSGNWTLATLRGAALVPDTAITLGFDKSGRVAGSGGCNRYAAPISLDGSNLKIGQPVSTRMVGAKPVMAQENRYLQALGKVAGFELDAGALILRDAGGAEVMRFNRTA
jgi:putative lipoprotein